MSKPDRSFSFQRLLERGDEAYRIYVTGDIRGYEVARFLTRFLPPAAGAKILDIGCGSGLLSFALASKYELVVAGDRQPENVSLTQKGRVERSIENLRIITLDAVKLPFTDGAFDGVVVNGVLEWVGVNDRQEDPGLIQRRFLNELHRVLRPGGVLYLSIENRGALRNLFRDPHTQQLVVGALARPLANWFSRTFYKRPFQAYIYTPGALARLLRRAGFRHLELFTPVPSYHYPFHYVSLSSVAESLRDINAIDQRKTDELLAQSPVKITADRLIKKLRQRSRYGMLKLTSIDITYIARSAGDAARIDPALAGKPPN